MLRAPTARRRVTTSAALAMYESLYPQERNPQGHPDLARSLDNLGVLLDAQGSYGEARDYERALAMRQSLYPKDRYPQGHPDLVISLNNLGTCSGHRAPTARRPFVFSGHGHATGPGPDIPGCYLGSRGDELPGPVAQDSGRPDFGIPSAARQRRRNLPADLGWEIRPDQLLHDPRQRPWVGPVQSGPPEDRDGGDARSRLARLILATADGREHPERAEMIRDLGSEKERLERELAAPCLSSLDRQTREQSSYRELLKILPMGQLSSTSCGSRSEQNPQVKGRQGMSADARLCRLRALEGPAGTDGGPRPGPAD